jgi:hypothetical protein
MIQVRYVRDWHRAYNDSGPFFEEVKRLYAGKRGFALSGTYYEFCYRGRVDILFWPANMVLEEVPYNELAELFYRFPFPRDGNGYQEVLRRYGVELVLCNEYALAQLSPTIFEGLEEIDMPPSKYYLYRVA